MRADSSNLDVLRSVAVTFVVVSHLLIEAGFIGNGIYQTQTLGTLGVLIFFVHTCLVLMLSLDRQAGLEARFPSTFHFLIRRAFRIYPLSIVVVLLVSSCAPLMSGVEPTMRTVLSNLLLIQNITMEESIPPVLWSLPYEFQMYFFLPMLYMLVIHSGKTAPYCIFALWLAAIGLVLIFRSMGWPFELIMFLPCFLPGVLAFCLRSTRQSFSPVVLFLVVGTAAILVPQMVGHGIKVTVFSWPFCLLLGLVIPKCRDIQRGWLQIMGKEVARYSYGIYLIHVPMINFSFHYLNGMPLILQCMTFAAGTAGISYIAHHVIEKPCIEFGKNVVNRLTLSRAQTGGKV